MSKKTVDGMNQIFQIGTVQRADARNHSQCKSDLDSKLQRHRGPLNTRQAHAVCGVVSLVIVPSLSNGWAGDFSQPVPLNLGLPADNTSAPGSRIQEPKVKHGWCGISKTSQHKEKRPWLSLLHGHAAYESRVSYPSASQWSGVRRDSCKTPSSESDALERQSMHLSKGALRLLHQPGTETLGIRNKA